MEPRTEASPNGFRWAATHLPVTRPSRKDETGAEPSYYLREKAAATRTMTLLTPELFFRLLEYDRYQRCDGGTTTNSREQTWRVRTL
ncbi:hypothetical protein MRX96_045787 [Rhipicephalus microplus]